MKEYRDLANAIIVGDNVKSKETTLKLVDDGVSALDILNSGLVPGMSVVGERFKANEMYIPEVLMAARAMHAAMKIIKPILSEASGQLKGTVVMGTVQGDLHDIGKNLVCMMLEGGGFKVIDIGIDVPIDKFLAEIKKNDAKVIGMSALLSTTMPAMKETIESLRADEVGKDVKIMIGGAPVTQEFADSIGADGYAPDASSAVDLANLLVKQVY